jgi:hypothetical protein
MIFSQNGMSRMQAFPIAWDSRLAKLHARNEIMMGGKRNSRAKTLDRQIHVSEVTSLNLVNLTFGSSLFHPHRFVSRRHRPTALRSLLTPTHTDAA